MIVLGIVALAVDAASTVKWLVLVLIVVSAVWVLVRYLKWATTNFVITSDRVIFRHGVFAKSGIEIPLERVEQRALQPVGVRADHRGRRPARSSPAPRADSNASPT